MIDFESWLLEKYDSTELIMEESNLKDLNRFSIYKGETIRKSLGGKWDIDLKNPDDALNRLPVIEHKKYGKECPITLVTVCLDRRHGDYIYSSTDKEKKS